MYRKIWHASLAAVAAGLIAFGSQSAHALGTAAGTTISNAATVNYNVASVAATPVTSTVTITVDEIIRVKVTAPAAPTAVTNNAVNQVSTFQVTNTGNGSEPFFLVVNRTVSGNAFDPLAGSAGSVFFDSNGNGVYDGPGSPTPDQAVPVSGPAPQLTLTADQVRLIFVVSNIPATPTTGSGSLTLTAQSGTTGAMASGAGTTAGVGATAGTTLTGAGTGGNDAVIGAGPGGAADSGSDDVATGTYTLANVTVAVSKAVLSVTSPLGVQTTGCNVATPPAGCTAFVPGTVIEYLVTVTVTGPASGSGVAQAVTMSDNVPASTTWTANSIRVGTTVGTLAVRTDVVDGDNGSCSSCGNATGTVIVNFGDVTATSGSPVINLVAYKVTVN